MKFDSKNKPALILVDIQKGFDDRTYWRYNRNNMDAEVNASRLLHLWRQKEWPVFHVKHCSTDPRSVLSEGNAGNEIKDIVKPLAGEVVISKNVNSAFIGTDLKQRLDELHISKLVVVGLTTDHCISTTVRMAGNLGYDTYVVQDATATFDKKDFKGELYAAQLIHETALASLHDEFATVINTSDILIE